MKKGKLYSLFNFVCIIGTVIMVTKCIYTYFLDEDVTQVEYRRFHKTEESSYPSTTICFNKPLKIFHQRKCIDVNSGKGINATQTGIRKFCKGTNDLDSQFRNQFNYSHYDEITLNLENYLSRVSVTIQNNGALQYNFINGTLKLKNAYYQTKENSSQFSEKQKASIKDPKMYVSHRGLQDKCYSFEPPYIRNSRIKRIRFLIDGTLLMGNKIFPQRKKFSVSFHLPHQELKALSTQDGWESKYDAGYSGYARKYNLANIEILKRRHKRSSPCVQGEYDSLRIQYAMKKVGCRPSIIETGKETKICETMQEYNRFEEQLTSDDFPPPCKEMESLDEWHGERIIDTEKELDEIRKRNKLLRKPKPILNIEIYFTDDIFKEVIYLKAYSIESLLGNVGGYIGKFNTILFKHNNVPFNEYIEFLF